MATINTLGPLTVTGANTATLISATRIPCTRFYIQAVSDNSDVIGIGDSTITNTKPGLLIAKPVSSLPIAPLAITGCDGAPNGLNLADWYFTSPSTGQKIMVVYIQG